MKKENLLLFESEEDYYNMPAYVSLYDIEDLVVNAINNYNDGKYSYSEIIRIMYSLGDSFSYNIEEMDLSIEIKQLLEKFVFELWNYKDKSNVNSELIMKVILDFGLQESYNKIINNIDYLKETDYDMYSFLNEVVSVNGKDISNNFEKYKSDRRL